MKGQSTYIAKFQNCSVSDILPAFVTIFYGDGSTKVQNLTFSGSGFEKKQHIGKQNEIVGDR